MTLHAYQRSLEVSALDAPFSSLIMAAIRKADTDNGARLMLMWPELWEEVEHRYWSGGGLLPGEDGYDPLSDDYNAKDG